MDVENLAIGILDHNLGMLVALVLDHDGPLENLHVRLFRLQPRGTHPHFFRLDRLAFDDIDEADNAGHFRQDRGTVWIPLEEDLTGLDALAVLDQDDAAVRHLEPIQFAVLLVRQHDLAVALERHRDRRAVIAFQSHCVDVSVLDFARVGCFLFAFENRSGRHAAGMERAKRQLRSRLADGLGRHDSHSGALLDHLARAHIPPVAFRTDANRAVAGQRAADSNGVQAEGLDFLSDLVGDHFVLVNDHLVGDGVANVVSRRPADDQLRQRDIHLVTTTDGALGDSLQRPAVAIDDDDVLGHVDELSRQIPGVGGLQSRIRQTLSGTVRGAEILEHRQTLAEVRLDRRFDDLPAGLGHQRSHSGELLDLVDTAAGPRIRHQVDRVQIWSAVLLGVLLEPTDHLVGHRHAGIGPRINDLVVPLTLGQHAAVVIPVNFGDALFGFRDDIRLLRGDFQVRQAEAQTRQRGVPEPQILDPVQQTDRLRTAGILKAIADDPAQLLLRHRQIVERHAVGQNIVEDTSPHGRVDRVQLDAILVGEPFFAGFVLEQPMGDPDPNSLVQRDLARFVSHHRLEHVAEDGDPLRLGGFRRAAGGPELVKHDRQVIVPHHHVLRRSDHGRAVRRREDVVRRHHQDMGFRLRLDAQRKVNRHLVTVEVRVEPLTGQGVQHDGVALDQNGLERLDAHPVQRRRTVQQNRVLMDDLLKDIPDLIVPSLDHSLGALDRIGVPVLLEVANDERLIQLQRDLFGEPTLVEFQIGTDDDHGPRRVVDAFAEQVLAEPALLALDHVGQRLQRPVIAAQNGPAAPAVVQQRIHRLLEHTLLVADDDFRGIQVNQLLQTVVAVDDPPVQVVQIARGEVVPFQEDQRPQVRRNHRDRLQNHPLRLIRAVLDLVDGLETLRQIPDLLLAVRLGDGTAQLPAELLEIQGLEEHLDRLGSHGGLERVAVLAGGVSILLLAEELARLERRRACVRHDVILEVDDLLEVRTLHPEDGTEPVGNRLEEPDVQHGRRQVDVAHALATHATVGHLDAATVTDDPLELRPLVLPAGAFPVALRSEYPFAEQTVLLRTIRAIIDRLGLAHFPKGPAPDVVRAGQGDLDRTVVINSIVDVSQHVKPLI